MGAELDPALVLMAKEPRPGQVKTRLAPALGLEGAATLYRAFLDDLLERLGRLPGIERRLAVWPAGAAVAPGHPRLHRWTEVDQRGDGLGERMEHALRSELAAGREVVLIGSDAPTIPARRILSALGRLRAVEGPEVVLGPDAGGGYYLVGLRRWVPGLFDVQMSTASVFEETRERVRVSGARFEELPGWYDVDTPEDLDRLRRVLRSPRFRRLAPATDRALRSLDRAPLPASRPRARYNPRP